MEWNDWLLAFHLLSAFALVAATILFWVFILTIRRTDEPEQVASVSRLLPVGTVVVAVGSLGTLIFGIWLAIALDGIQVWDGWVIAAIVLWAITTETGRRADPEFAPAVARGRELVVAGQTAPDPELHRLATANRGLLFGSISTLAVLLLLIDMIWKPGA